MIQFTITTDALTENGAETGRIAGPVETHLDPSDKIYAIEVSSLWNSIRAGGFESQAKSMLEKLCTERGLNAVELLR